MFHDDFEGDLNRWEILDPKTWKQTQREGNKFLEITERRSAYQPKVRSPFHAALVKGVELGDFVLIFRVRSPRDSGAHRDCTPIFCFQDPSHFYYAHLGAQPVGSSGQIMIVDGAPRHSISKNKNPVPWDDKWHTVKVVRTLADGGIRVYFDDMAKPIMETSDKTFGRGRVGIGTFDDVAEFDDVAVYGKP